MPNSRAHDHLTDHNWQLEIEGVSGGAGRAGDPAFFVGAESGKGRVPAHTPEWTNPNDSDPGVSVDTPDGDIIGDFCSGDLYVSGKPWACLNSLRRRARTSGRLAILAPCHEPSWRNHGGILIVNRP